MPPLRLLTDDVKKRITRFYSKPFYTNFGLMFTLCFGAPIVGVLGSIGGRWLLFPLLAIWAFIFYLLLSVKTKKIKKAREVYQFGQETTIYFQGLDYNYSIRVNGAPQQIILLRINNETIRIKTFSRRVLNAFSVPIQTAYIMDKYPNTILPAALFTAEITNKPTRLRSIDM